MSKLSVIIPYVNEWPQIVFTIRSIVEELADRVDFEIIVVDNFCDEVAKQGCTPDRSAAHFREVEKGQSWLKFLTYDEKLSHWNAKRKAVEGSTGDILWFCDAHCMVGRDALFKMFKYYEKNHQELNGSLHLPLTYAILEWHKLTYKPVIDVSKGIYHYSFTSYKTPCHGLPYNVKAMSTCGMMVTRELYDLVGGWPEELGIYGGGENFINYTLAVLGKHKWIMPGKPLHHHGDKRGYSFNGDDYLRNRCIASFMFGGYELADLMMRHSRGGSRVKRMILEDVASACKSQRELIQKRQVVTIEEWAATYKEGIHAIPGIG